MFRFGECGTLTAQAIAFGIVQERIERREFRKAAFA